MSNRPSPVLETGPETSGRPSPGTTDVPGGDHRGGAPQLRVGGLVSKTGNRQRHPESPRRQGAARKRAAGRDDGETSCAFKVVNFSFNGSLTIGFFFKSRKGLFHHPENAHVGQRNLLPGAGHLRGHEPPGPEHPPEKTVWSALIRPELSLTSQTGAKLSETLDTQGLLVKTSAFIYLFTIKNTND